MTFGPDIVAELTRLGGVTLMATAVVFGLLDDARATTMRLTLLGTLLLLLGCFAVLLATVAPIAARLEEPLTALALEYFQTTSHGPKLLTPILPAIYSLLLIEGLRVVDSAGFRRALYWMLAASVLAILSLMAASGHVATTNLEHIGMFLQIVHMACGVAWVALLLYLLPRVFSGRPLAADLQRVGNTALLLVITLIVTGTGSAWLHGAPLPWPMDEDYGRLLLLKTLVLLLALAAAGWNRFIELPATAPNEARLRSVVGMEAAILLLALLLAAWLTRTPPPG